MTAPPIAAETIAARICTSVPTSPPVNTEYKRDHEQPERFVLREQTNDDGIVLDRAHHPAARDREVDHLREHQVACTRPGLLGISGVESGFQLRQLDFDRGEHDLVLGLELVVDRGLRHADGVGDHLERRPVDTVLGEQAEGGIDDADLRGCARNGAQAADARARRDSTPRRG